MGFDQYHEPANELSEETRTFARMIMKINNQNQNSNKHRCPNLFGIGGDGRSLFDGDRNFSNR